VNDVRIGLLGLGTVGAGVVKILQSRREMLQERAGATLSLAAIADTDLTRPREGLDIRALPMVGDAGRVLDDPSIHVVIELVGGLEPARTFILRALNAGKHVVTANKALLAHHGAELYDEARRRGVSLAFEAAVAGGIPLIRAVKEGLVANRVLSLAGIVNGTCNYILSKMTDEGLDFSLVLKEAQAHGYAEADPTLDIEGMDSAHKLQILVALAFRTFIDLKHIHTEGITRVTAQDIEYARELGYRIKLLAIAKAAERGVEVRVHPTMIPAASPLAAVSGVFNAIFLTGDAVGDLMFYGRGAGQMPTASAVWSDVLEVARRVAHGIPALALELPSVGPQPLPLHGPGRPGRALAGDRHPGREQHLHRQRHPEGARHARGGAGRDAHARGARARHAHGPGRDRSPARRRDRHDHDPRRGRPRVTITKRGCAPLRTHVR
jgi:homoserine dehydrogenase